MKMQKWLYIPIKMVFLMYNFLYRYAKQQTDRQQEGVNAHTNPATTATTPGKEIGQMHRSA